MWCLLGVTSLNFQHGITDKVQAVREFPQPQSQRQLRRFIGLVNFYRADLMQPLHSLISSAKPKTQHSHGTIQLWPQPLLMLPSSLTLNLMPPPVS